MLRKELINGCKDESDSIKSQINFENKRVLLKEILFFFKISYLNKESTKRILSNN
tara:strand:- start:1003 stop:1167 length:165 start_codon:yes stop_codon:yes gene_type:complete